MPIAHLAEGHCPFPPTPHLHPGLLRAWLLTRFSLVSRDISCWTPNSTWASGESSSVCEKVCCCRSISSFRASTWAFSRSTSSSCSRLWACSCASSNLCQAEEDNDYTGQLRVSISRRGALGRNTTGSGKAHSRGWTLGSVIRQVEQAGDSSDRMGNGGQRHPSLLGSFLGPHFSFCEQSPLVWGSEIPCIQRPVAERNVPLLSF